MKHKKIHYEVICYGKVIVCKSKKNAAKLVKRISKKGYTLCDKVVNTKSCHECSRLFRNGSYAPVNYLYKE